jgi:chemotaxis receptor (MCP) glutamine deamidase CheD
MNPNELANAGIVTQLAMVHTMLPKVKELIDQQLAEIEALKAKTLTDEEIIEIWSGMETDTGEQNIAFARAILRKAKEK